MRWIIARGKARPPCSHRGKHGPSATANMSEPNAALPKPSNDMESPSFARIKPVDGWVCASLVKPATMIGDACDGIFPLPPYARAYRPIRGASVTSVTFCLYAEPAARFWWAKKEFLCAECGGRRALSRPVLAASGSADRRLCDVARFVLGFRRESCGKHRAFPAQNLGSGDHENAGVLPRFVNCALSGLLQPCGEPILDAKSSHAVYLEHLVAAESRDGIALQ